MDWSQQIFVAGLVIATLHGGQWRLAAMMWFNLILTMTFALEPLMVGVADLLCASALITMGARGMVLSALFLLMLPIYVVFWLFSWPISTTYAIVDCIAVVQILVLANVDKYLRNNRRSGASSGRGARSVLPLAHRTVQEDVAVSKEAGGR